MDDPGIGWLFGDEVEVAAVGEVHVDGLGAECEDLDLMPDFGGEDGEEHGFRGESVSLGVVDSAVIYLPIKL